MIAMKFIELTGETLKGLLHAEEMHPGDLEAAGVTASTIVRVNQHGDIEVRRRDGWDVVGGLIGDFETRLRHQTKLDWA
jgi:hypothetical protein